MASQKSGFFLIIFDGRPDEHGHRYVDKSELISRQSGLLGFFPFFVKYPK